MGFDVSADAARLCLVVPLRPRPVWTSPRRRRSPAPPRPARARQRTDCETAFRSRSSRLRPPEPKAQRFTPYRSGGTMTTSLWLTGLTSRRRHVASAVFACVLLYGATGSAQTDRVAPVAGTLREALDRPLPAGAFDAPDSNLPPADRTPGRVPAARDARRADFDPTPTTSVETPCSPTEFPGQTDSGSRDWRDRRIPDRRKARRLARGQQLPLRRSRPPGLSHRRSGRSRHRGGPRLSMVGMRAKSGCGN